MTSEAPQDVAALPQTEAGKRLLDDLFHGTFVLEPLDAILAIEREAAAAPAPEIDVEPEFIDAWLDSVMARLPTRYEHDYEAVAAIRRLTPAADRDPQTAKVEPVRIADCVLGLGTFDFDALAAAGIAVIEGCRISRDKDGGLVIAGDRDPQLLDLIKAKFHAMPWTGECAESTRRDVVNLIDSFRGEDGPAQPGTGAAAMASAVLNPSSSDSAGDRDRREARGLEDVADRVGVALQTSRHKLVAAAPDGVACTCGQYDDSDHGVEAAELWRAHLVAAARDAVLAAPGQAGPPAGDQS